MDIHSHSIEVWKIGLLLLLSLNLLEAGVITKSSLDQCIVEDGLRNLNNSICKNKLVVSLTVTSNEGKSTFIEANVSRILDATEQNIKNIELRQPLRIRVTKSPVIINFRLYQVGYVANQPREVINNTLGRRRFRCREFWYNNPVNCEFALDEKGERIFDSQGFCCKCSFQSRGASEFCVADGDELTRDERRRYNNGPSGNLRVGHCLVFDKLRYFVMGIYPPELRFTINVDIERRSYLTTNGTGVWETVSQLEIGPQKRIAVSKTHNVRVEYLADFFPNTFTQSDRLVHRYLLIPDLSTLGERPPHISQDKWREFDRSIRNMSEWMFVNKKLFDLSGFSCNKIGVSYTAFRIQTDACLRPFGSCLHNVPWDLWNAEKTRQRENIRGLYMAYNYGKVHSLPHTSGRTDFQVNYIADRSATSLILVTLAADDLRVITRVSPGRIVSAFIDSFEALSTTGTLLAVIQNTGTFTATYDVYVQHCSAGIDLIPSRIVTINPLESSNVSFVVHSFHAIGKINFCELNLYDANSRLLDNMTVAFETTDTCFCYGYCGCACGINKTVCPDAPDRKDSESSLFIIPAWLTRLDDILKGLGRFLFNHGTKIIILFWVILVLYCLGIIKLVHMVVTQEVKMGVVVEPMQIIAEKAKAIAEHILKDVCPTFCDNFWTGCATCWEYTFRKCICCLTFGKLCGTNRVVGKRRVERGWRVPPYCNGMCDGARFRRKVHRKLMRVNKRSGNIKDIPWFQRPYNCTCKVKDEMPCIMICRGLFFFFYCPLLPVWWVLEFSFKFLRRSWRRRKRIKQFRAERAVREERKRQAYVHLDEYSRGKLENEIFSLDKELKEIKQLEKEYQADQTGFNPELEEFKLEEESEREERNVSADGSLSDTSDPEQANEIDELLSPGFPVYFNFAIQNTSHSLKNPGDSYSIKGRLTQIKDTDQELEGTLEFDLHTYDTQVMHISKNKLVKLKPTQALNHEEFLHSFKDSGSALKLISLTPLFSCLNDTKPSQKGTKLKKS